MAKNQLNINYALAAPVRLQGRSAAIPNQGISNISLQEAKASSEVENILTTDNELYRAYRVDVE
jgi:hypothetical protein